ncbi:MAG TPA: septation protein IspZ [bacterium]|nr:septation protein IspZ [bacterium]
MNRYAILKTMLPPMIPLLVFILADEIWGTKVGIIVALVSGIIEYIYVLIKEKRSDRFILADTLLLVVLGGVSILLENAVFFKLKPALIEAIFCVILGISVFSDKNILLQMTKRYMKGMELNEKGVEKMRRTFRNLFWIFSFHTLLVIYSAFFMSERAWAFISTALFYIIFGIYFVFEILLMKYTAKKR